MALSRLAVSFFLLALPTGLANAQQSNPSPSLPSPTSPGVLGERNCVVAGRVLYAHDYRPVERVLVTVLWNSVPTERAFTDSLGRFAAQRLRTDIYEVEVKLDGYKPARMQVDLSSYCRSELPPILLEREAEESVLPAGAMVAASELRVPARARKAFEKGLRELHEKHRPERSLPYFNEAIDIYPDFDGAYMQLGVAYSALARYPQAQQELEKSTAINDRNPRAFVLLGIVHGRQGHAADSLRALREAVRLDKGDWLGHFELGRVLLQAGLVEDAYKHAQRAHLLKPDRPSVHLLLHDVCVSRRDHVTALAELKEFLELFPDSALAARVRKQQESLQAAAARPQ